MIFYSLYSPNAFVFNYKSAIKKKKKKKKGFKKKQKTQTWDFGST